MQHECFVFDQRCIQRGQRCGRHVCAQIQIKNFGANGGAELAYGEWWGHTQSPGEGSFLKAMETIILSRLV